MNPGENPLIIPGPVGPIEASVTIPRTETRSIVGVVCHPHPLQEGTMNNKVVTTVARAFRDMGVVAVRFNYRGVGASQGTYGEGIGETDDTLSVLEWVRETFSPTEIWLAGFSFGGAVAYRAASAFDVNRLVCIAPSVKRVDLNVPEPACPIIAIQGDADEIVLLSDVEDWINRLANKPQLIKLEGAEHFFHGQLLELKDIILGLAPVS